MLSAGQALKQTEEGIAQRQDALLQLINKRIDEASRSGIREAFISDPEDSKIMASLERRRFLKEVLNLLKRQGFKAKHTDNDDHKCIRIDIKW